MSHAENIKQWGGPRDAFEIADVSSKGGETWNAHLLTTAMAGRSGLSIDLRAAEGWVWLAMNESLPPDLAELIQQSPALERELPALVATLHDERPGSTSCMIRGQGDSALVELRVGIHSEGFTRHELNAAVLELAKSMRVLEQRFNTMIGTAQMIADSRRELEAEERETRRLVAESEKAIAEVTAAQPDPAPAAATGAAGSRSHPPLACHSCGSPNPSSSRFCNQCGKPLGCPQCGADNPPGSHFCSQCGTELGGRA